jgi:ABC-type transporter Mla MlaB component
MPLRITQIENSICKKTTLRGGRNEQPCVSGSESKGTVLKVEGSLYLKDAELLEKICRDVGSQTQQPVALDLTDLSYLDSDSASVLCRMRRDQRVGCWVYTFL